MKIEINGSGDAPLNALQLFHDLTGLYASVDKWLGAIVEGRSHYKPVDVMVWACGMPYQIIEAGAVMPCADEVISLISRQPLDYRVLPHDGITVQANAAARNLYVALLGTYVP